MQAEKNLIAAFHRAVAEGEAQLDRGQGTEYSRERMTRIADTARESLGSGGSIDPDVMPECSK